MAETMPTFVPGDYITYVVYLAYPGNIREVVATFYHEQVSDAEIAIPWRNPYQSRDLPAVYLTGGLAYGKGWTEANWEAQLISDPRIEGTRTHVAVLTKEIYKSQEPGRYRLKKLKVTTYGDKELTIDTPPSAEFRIEQEPDISALPSTAVLPPTGFHLPEGHPDRPQGQ
jgi:hypothetical protein